MEYATQVLVKKMHEIETVLATISEPCPDYSNLLKLRFELEMAIHILSSYLPEKPIEVNNEV